MINKTNEYINNRSFIKAQYNFKEIFKNKFKNFGEKINIGDLFIHNTSFCIKTDENDGLTLIFYTISIDKLCTYSQGLYDLEFDKIKNIIKLNRGF